MTEIDASGSYGGIIGIVCVEDATGAVSDADSTPTIKIFPYTEDDDDYASLLSAGIEHDETGVYRFVVYPSTSNAAYTTQGPFWAVVEVVIGGVTKKIPLAPFIFIPPKRYGRIDTDGSNSATSFKVVGVNSGHGGWYYVADDNPAFSILAMMTGDLAGEIAEVDSYDATTHFITLKRALTGIPADGELFQLINR